MTPEAPVEPQRVVVGPQNRAVVAGLLAAMDPDGKKIVTCRQCDWAGARSECARVDEPGHHRWNCPVCKHAVERRPL